MMRTGNALETICKRYGLALVYLFGSRAEAGAKLLAGEKVVENDPLSDIDLGIVTDGPLPEPTKRPSFYAALYNEFEEVFKPLRLDLVLLEPDTRVSVRPRGPVLPASPTNRTGAVQGFPLG